MSSSPTSLAERLRRPGRIRDLVRKTYTNEGVSAPARAASAWLCKVPSFCKVKRSDNTKLD